MKVSDEIRRLIFKLILALFAAQLIIVPWSWGVSTGLTSVLGDVYRTTTQYAPIFSKPVPFATIAVGRLLVQLVVTGGAAVAWLAFTKTEEG